MAQQQPSLRVLSLGAGVQSTTLALMAAHGDIAPMPDCAIFADTGWEPRAVYEHLAWRGLRDGSPEEWADAVAVDAALREGDGRSMAGVEYMHASRQPLDEVDLSTAIERSQGDLFINECEGMCGV